MKKKTPFVEKRVFYLTKIIIEFFWGERMSYPVEAKIKAVEMK
ncbi:hypothetical protein [Lysinibacillus sp. NPDC056232]